MPSQHEKDSDDVAEPQASPHWGAEVSSNVTWPGGFPVTRLGPNLPVAIALPPRRKECHNPIYHARANLPTLSWGFGKLLKRLTGCGHGVWMLPMQPRVEEKGKDSWGNDVAASPNGRRFAWPLFTPFSFRHCHAAGQIVFGNFFGGCFFLCYNTKHLHLMKKHQKWIYWEICEPWVMSLQQCHPTISSIIDSNLI